MKAVKALLKRHPNFLLPGGDTEVHEVLPMGSSRGMEQ
jgi:hypothetical protein